MSTRSTWRCRSSSSTRRASNVLANPVVELLVIHPAHGAMYRINARYLRTETDGALFERMKAKLAGIASHTGMSGVFRLRGADLYEVRARRPGSLAAPRSRRRRAEPAVGAAPLRRSAWPRSSDLDSLVERLLDGVVDDFGIRHAMLLMLDAAGQRLYTVGSRGYGALGCRARKSRSARA